MLNRLATILPPDLLSDTTEATAKLLPAILLRANFIPGVRQRLGWRGIKECPDQGFSMKIADRSGIYGLSPAGLEVAGASGTALFALHYFPAPDEDLMEQFSVAACVAALQEDYLRKVREFPRHEPFRQLFGVGRLELSFSAGGAVLGLAVRAEQTLMLISADGVTVRKDGLETEIVAPGDVDQKLSAFDLSYDFFRILAASFSFCLGFAPSALTRQSRAAGQVVYSQNNPPQKRPCRDNREIDLALTWGAAADLKRAGNGGFDTEIDWREGQDKPDGYGAEPWWQMRVPGARFSVDKNTMGISERPRLIILTGFLGSGKTSFLNHFVEYQATRNAFVAIVQNEIGARNLDTRLLGQHYAVTEMDEGCICCSLSGNLKLALAEIADGFQPDFIVVETTGLANPANFLSEISELDDQLDFCSLTTVIDASLGLSTLHNYDVAHEQVALADVILVNKIDGIPAERLEALITTLRDRNPQAKIHTGNHGDFSAPDLYGVNQTGHAELADGLAKLKAARRHTHTHNRIASELIEIDRPLDRMGFLFRTSQLPSKVLRMKGIVQFTDSDQAYYYQYVPGSYSLTPAPKETCGDHFLVVIGEDIQNSAAALFTFAGKTPATIGPAAAPDTTVESS